MSGDARRAYEDLSDAVTAYMLGEVDGAHVALVQRRTRLELAPGTTADLAALQRAVAAHRGRGFRYGHWAPDPSVHSTEPVTWWWASVRRPWGRVDHDVYLWRHVSAPPIPGVEPAEWFRDDSLHTDVPREHLTDLRPAGGS